MLPIPTRPAWEIEIPLPLPAEVIKPLSSRLLVMRLELTVRASVISRNWKLEMLKSEATPFSVRKLG